MIERERERERENAYPLRTIIFKVRTIWNVIFMITVAVDLVVFSVLNVVVADSAQD